MISENAFENNLFLKYSNSKMPTGKKVRFPKKPDNIFLKANKLEELESKNKLVDVYKSIVIDLFKTRKIIQARTVTNMIELLNSNRKNKFEIFSQKLKKIMEKSQGKREIKREEKQKAREEEVEAIIEKANAKRKTQKSKEKYLLPRVVFIVDEAMTTMNMKNAKTLPEPLKGKTKSVRQLNVEASETLLEKINHKYVYLKEMFSVEDKKEIKKRGDVLYGDDELNKEVEDMLKSDPEVQKDWMKGNELMPYLTGIVVKNYQKVGAKKKFKIAKELLKNPTKQSICHKYVETNINLNSQTLKEAIKNNYYIKNECFINSLFEVYGKTLLKQDKPQHKHIITRENILELIGKTEEDVKYGISINEMLPFFKKYNLRLRIINEFSNIVKQYDPEKVNKNFPPFYGLIKDNHIYTLNFNHKELEQKVLQTNDLEIFASENFKCDSQETVPHKMVDSVHDLLKLTRNIKSEENQTLYIVLRNNDLVGAFYDLMEIGYAPSVKYNMGTICQLHVKFENIYYIIRNQQLVPDLIGSGDINVEDETVYNNMNSAMCNFRNKIFINDHKSYYSENDLEMLNEYRTVVPVGALMEIPSAKNNIIEIDLRKAFTSAFLKIDEIPIFNEFDNFLKYDGNEIQDFNLYVVQPDQIGVNLFLNKKYNLVYGKFLQQLEHIKILFYKSPSFIHKVDYKKHVEELFNEKTSDNKLKIHISKN